MPLRLIRADETTTLSIGGTTFTVRKLPHGATVALNRKHTRRGKIDEDALTRELWPLTLVGWTDLYDRAGNLVPYSRDEVPYLDPLTGEPVKDPETGAPVLLPLPVIVGEGLPQAVAEAIFAASRGAEVHVHEALGNSGPSSASG